MTDLLQPSPQQQSDSQRFVNARLVSIYNMHNGPFNDRGTRKINVVLRRQKADVWRKDGVDLVWLKGREAKTNVSIPHDVAFDTLRLEIVEYVGFGGGLSEVEVYVDSLNIVAGLPVTASGTAKPQKNAKVKADVSPAKITDGVRRSNQWGRGYWVAPDGAAAWIEISLTATPAP
ncbi:MAG: hypothetical protein HYV60_01015 [Planctomycetia bacterium]|nr:hypothetical protein [Planctomycetia bacterium]